MANKELDKLRGMSVSDLNKSLETIYKEQFEDNLLTARPKVSS